jgi:tRNA nucleotidyltransferase (CCA-adding enzyme)
MLDLFGAVDALRRPERLAMVLEASAADACSRPGASQDYPPAMILNEALAVVRRVDAGAIARIVIEKNVASGPGSKGRDAGDAVAKAVRSARLAALRQWRRAGTRAPDQTR